MTLFLYLSNVVLARTESALGKYNGRRSGGTLRFNVVKTLSAAVLCGIIALITGIRAEAWTVALSLLYGGSLALSMHAGLKALSLGNMAIVSMLASFSLVIPCLWGLLFLNEGLTLAGGIGLLLLALSIVLLNVKDKGERLSLSCWIYSLLTMLANGACSVIQKSHQALYPGEYRTEFMLFSMAFTALIFLSAALISKRGAAEKEASSIFNIAVPLGLLAGICNCFANYSVLSLAASENATVLFPILSATNAIGACLVGRLFFKERLTPLQLISICLGIASVVLLKL